jgi:sec-independent protein translocase protein TatB
MFDFSFSEIALIGVVALVVIGPERLPRVARTAGVVLGRVQRYAATVRADIAREVELSELRRVQGELRDAARSFESGVRDSLVAAETHFETARAELMSGPQAAALTTDVERRADLANSTGDPAAGVAAPALGRPPAPDASAGAAESLVFQASLFAPAEAPPGDSAAPGPGYAPAAAADFVRDSALTKVPASNADALPVRRA